MLNAPPCDAHDSDEQGSLVLALAVLMILTMLALAVLARSVAGLTEARRTQDSASALSAAEAGLADAVAHIGADASGDLAGTGTLHGAQFTWTAHRVDGLHFTVASTGTAGLVHRGVAATVSRPGRFPYALFSDQDLVVDGASVSVSSGAVGSNHALVAQSTAGSRQDWFTPAGSCSGCAAPQLSAGPRVVVPPDVPSAPLPCPAANTFTDVVARGEYNCVGDVAFSGNVAVGPGTDPLIVHATGALALDGATVNPGGAAVDVQLFVAGDEVRMGAGFEPSTFVGAIEAPSARLVLGDQPVDITGAVTVSSVIARPSVHVFRYDPSLDDVAVGGWSLSGWHEVAG